MPLTLIHLNLPHWTEQIRINCREIQIWNEVGVGVEEWAEIREPEGRMISLFFMLFFRKAITIR